MADESRLPPLVSYAFDDEG
jgi:hypothetical protein